MTTNPLRSLPAMNQLLAAPALQAAAERYGLGVVKWQAGQRLEELRQALRSGALAAAPAIEGLALTIAGQVERLCDPARRTAVNATGILLHTGLGRAPLSAAATAAVAAAAGVTPVQADPIEGRRSRREALVEQVLQQLTGCEAATVVNNNAAATMLVLKACAAGREVIVSRGQLIEIGGAFRLPDVMAMSGCRLREVGTTNRTHLKDYRAAIGPETGAIIHVHTSNFRVRGFAGTPGIAALVALGREHDLPVIDDLGSGALVPLRPWDLSDEPLVGDSLSAGADLCCFSGDKLIGGPQAGIILGRQTWIDRVRSDPFARMFRVCKLTLAGLEASLLAFLGGTWRQDIPFYRLLDRSLDALQAQAERITAALDGHPALTCRVVETQAFVGSGSLPDEAIPSLAVQFDHRDLGAHELARRLRAAQPAIFARLEDDRVTLDLRTCEADSIEAVIAVLRGFGDA